MRVLVILILAAQLAIAAPVAATDPPPKGEYVEHTEMGTIEWSRAVIVAEGTQPPAGKDAANPDQRRKDIAMARLDAQQKLLQTVARLRVDSTTTLGDAMAQSTAFRKGIEGIVRHLPVSRQQFLSDGTVIVHVELPMHGAFAQLVLPEQIKQIEDMKILNAPPAKPDTATAVDGQPAQQPPPIFTGLVVDARGLRFYPALMPTIYDETGEMLYGSAFASREYAVQRGMVLYLSDPNDASRSERLGTHPLTVKAVRINGAKQSEIVLSNNDAATLRSASEHLTFLKQCRVVIVVDPPKTKAATPPAG